MSIVDVTTFSGAFDWVIMYGYPLMFLAMLIEGPVVTAAAAFAATFGYFNIFIVFILSLFGDMTADVIYYAVGYFGRIMVVQKFGRHFGLADERIGKIEALFNRHPSKILVALKLTPVLSTPGLMIAGASRIPLKNFIAVCSAVILPKTIFFMMIGYYFGSAYTIVSGKYEKGGLVFGILLFVIIGIYYATRKFSAHLAVKIEKI